MHTLALSFLAAGMALAAGPTAAAQGHSAPKAGAARHVAHHSDSAAVLRARLASINMRIDMLRDRSAIGSEEAQNLRRQARRLELQLYGMSRRGARDVAFGVDRLETRVGFAMDARNRDLDRSYGDRDRYERFERYQSDRSGDYEHFDRYTGSSVDRWHDPFDRGNN